jgi:ribosomal-protein-alanine N-acetyltransferase
MTITVQDASMRSLKRLYQIEKECFMEEAFTKKQISLLLTDYNSVSLMAKENGEIVGFVVGIIYPDGKTINGHILTIDVSTSYRRRGVGQMLLQEMEKIFVQKGVQACLLEVKEGNVAAISLYRKLGYEEIGRLKNYYGKTDGICLRRILPKASKGLG